MTKKALAQIEACEALGGTLRELVDDYYLPIMEDKTNYLQQLHQVMSTDWAQEVFPQMPPDWVDYLPTTVLTYECFKKDGLFTKRPELEREAAVGSQAKLLCQAFHEKPWQYSYCRITKKVRGQFFEMVDILNGEKFELYSKSVDHYLQEFGKSVLFGVLRFWNGHCWQTYSNLSYFISFHDFDLLSFARAVDPYCTDKADVYRILDKNLLPFLALFCYAQVPIAVHQKQPLRFIQTTCACSELPLEAMAKDFQITKVQGVYHLELKPYPNRMLVAEAFWAPKKKELVVEASTFEMQTKLKQSFHKHGIQIPPAPDFEMGISMKVAIHSILQKELQSPLARRFQSKSRPEMDPGELETVNQFMALLVDKLNHKRVYDLKDLAQFTGLDLDTAKALEQVVLKQLAAI